MNLGNRVKEAIISKTAEALAVAGAVVIIWAASKISPVILPALESNLSPKILVTLLIASLALNVIVIILFWVFNKKSELQVKYGVLWDKAKNPYCPNCKIPVSGYNDYGISGKGFFCKSCDNIFPLTDVSGNEVNPEKAIKEL